MIGFGTYIGASVGKSLKKRHERTWLLCSNRIFKVNVPLGDKPQLTLNIQFLETFPQMYHVDKVCRAFFYMNLRENLRQALWEWICWVKGQGTSLVSFVHTTRLPRNSHSSSQCLRKFSFAPVQQQSHYLKKNFFFFPI